MFNSILTICSLVCFKIVSILLLNKDNRLQKVSVIDSMQDRDCQKGNKKCNNWNPMQLFLIINVLFIHSSVVLCTVFKSTQYSIQYILQILQYVSLKEVFYVAHVFLC